MPQHYSSTHNKREERRAILKRVKSKLTFVMTDVPEWLSPLLASPPAPTTERLFTNFEHARSNLLIRQHLSSLFVLHVTPAHAAFAREADGVTVQRVEFLPVLNARELVAFQKKAKKAQRHKAAAAGAAAGGDDEIDGNDDDADAMHICALHLSDGSRTEVVVRAYGELRDTNPLLADGSLQLTSQNCLTTGYLALILPTTMFNTDFKEGKHPQWKSVGVAAAGTTTTATAAAAEGASDGKAVATPT